MDLFTISALKQAAADARVEARVHGQVEAVQRKETREQTPYYEVGLVDAGATLKLRAWSDAPVFHQCAQLQRGHWIEVAGEFTVNGKYGLDARRWTLRHLTPEEREAVLAGPAELRAKQARDFQWIAACIEQLGDPRLRALGLAFLERFGDRFRRTAAARNYHHARRGGLVEHTAQMLRAAAALCGVYQELNPDLLYAGVVFHDCGKLWENALPDDGFVMPYDERGELMGHITIGIELVNKLWHSLPLDKWKTLDPPSEDVRLHLLHLIAAHHGGHEFGSPVDPKTPEAWALHHLDNLDARLEMMQAGYQAATPLGPRIFERVRPLPGNLVRPLDRFTAPVREPHAE